MDRIIAVTIVIILLIVGLVRLFRRVKHVGEKIKSANEFYNKFSLYLKSQGEDSEIYAWLIQKSPKIQSEMGAYGYLDSFRPPYANYVIRNYQIIVNIIPEIRRELQDDSYLRNVQALNEYGALVQESLLRHLGVLSDKQEIEKQRLKNPIIWLSEGVSWVLLFPISVLSWVGLIGETIVRKITLNPLFKMIAGILTILGGFSTLMTIVVGWDSFINALNNIFTP